MPLSLRITRELDAELKRRAAAEQISPSALVHRILRQVLHSGQEPVLTVEQVEEIARRSDGGRRTDPRRRAGPPRYVGTRLYLGQARRVGANR